MFREFFLSEPISWVGLVVFAAHETYRAWLSLQLNHWYGVFYDLLQGGMQMDDLSEARGKVSELLLQFAFLVMPAVIIHPLAGLIRNWFVFVWRRSLIESYTKNWRNVEGASQRIQEDTKAFASGLQTCSSISVQAILNVILFSGVILSIDATIFAIALSVAITGILVSVVAGWPLVGLEVQNQVVEAELRKKLVLREANGQMFDAYATIDRLTKNYKKLYFSFAVFGVWLSFYDQFGVILPYILAAPRLFAEDPSQRLTLGDLTRLSNSFSKVFDSFSVITNQWVAVNEFRATLRRLRQYERAPIEIELTN